MRRVGISYAQTYASLLSIFDGCGDGHCWGVFGEMQVNIFCGVMQFFEDGNGISNVRSPGRTLECHFSDGIEINGGSISYRASTLHCLEGASGLSFLFSSTPYTHCG